MFSHIMVGTNDVDKAKAFYSAVLGTLGAGDPMVNVNSDGQTRLFWIHNGGVFGVSEPIDGQPACHANGATIGFACDSLEQVTAFHDAGVANGGTSIEDPPGLRESEMGNMNLSYVRDPDGNKLCAMHRAG
ncbi:VOC family protein [Parasphingopyxis sp. CP4]|uniref:VOC family protein n=1 Tax=Parasphingopyxis sp. CP4 TaxID=2724527 RepID=UPI0015A4E174|nr:VOC family protein [Parasphingopyxis sp. CP4]QLC22062.1 VOC family protein [Parasphingopyxis sp. CP4]